MFQPDKFLDSLLTQVGTLLPGVFGSLLVLIVGLFISSLVRKLTARLLGWVKLDERLSKSGGNVQLEFTLSKIVYYIVLVYVLLIVLNMMGVTSVLAPLENMIHEFLGYLPNIVAAVIIGFAGYVIATIVSESVGAVSGALDTITKKVPALKELNLSKIVKQLVFLFVFIPVLIAALQALEMKVISEPATSMLNDLMSSIPKIIAASIIIAVFYIGGKYVTAILQELIKNVGGDDIPAKIKLDTIITEKYSLSKVVANIVFFFIMFSGVISALEKLEMMKIADTLNALLALSGQIVFGLIIMAVGNFVAGFAQKALINSNAKGFSGVAKVAVLGLFLAIALRSMGIANEIVNLAFGLTLGSVAVAIALSFGLGGREAAGKQMEYILQKFRGEDKK